LGALAVLGAIAVTLAVTGVHLANLYSDYKSCTGFTCDAAFNAVDGSYRHVRLIGALIVLVPALAGVFWGAPLVARELETGTYRLAWVQGVSRDRWLWTRLAVSGLATAVAVGVLTFAFTWWAIPIDRLGHNRLDPSIFSERAIVPVAYALFAFALGVAAGALLRRTMAAMAVTLVGFTAVRLVTQIFVRPHLLAPMHKVVPLTDRPGLGIQRSSAGLSLVPQGSPKLPGAWVTGTKLVDSTGHAPTTAFVNHACHSLLTQTPPPGAAGAGPKMRPIDGPAFRALQDCLTNVSARFHEVVSYQPASRFWELQWLESAIFLGVAALLVALTVYWVRRRLV
jgi:hypothetical protein